jgi:hypothetical protein
LESILARDPGGRGVASFHVEGRLLAAGQLEAAARSLAQRAGHVAIVTGFCVATAGQPHAQPAAETAAETDGPPGALYLARALAALGRPVTLISDLPALALLHLGCKNWNLSEVALVEFPFASMGLVEASIDRILDSPGRGPLTHLVAIERAGPSHTLASLAAQKRVGVAPLSQFKREVPPEERDVCHNMRGEPIDARTAPVHRLFEAVAARRLPIETIGLADGGNEIGAGAVPWEILREAIAQGPAARIACRIATDHLLLAGVSNWAAYALAGAVAVLRGRGDLVDRWGDKTQRQLIETLVREGGAVDGVSGRREATVDGLPLESYLATMREIGEVIRS